MDELKNQLAAIEQQLEAEKAKGGARDMSVISVLEHNQADILAAMDQFSKSQEVQTAVATAQTDIMDSLAEFTYNGETFSIYQFTETIEAANVLIGYIQERIGTITAGAISYKQELDAVTLKLEDAEESMTKLREENDRLDRLGADLQAKRDAAGEEILNLQEENKRLNQELNNLRENVVAKPANTNLNGNAGQSIADWKAARPYIYNLHWKDEYKKTTYLANYASNGEELEFSRLAIGKYNVLESEEEALQFRTNSDQTSGETPQTTEPVQETTVSNSPLDTIEPPALPSEAEVQNADTTSGGDAAISTVVAEVVSRAEFEELKARVTAIEKNTDVVAMFG